MQNHLEEAIRHLKTAEDYISYAANDLEREIKVPVRDSEASRRRSSELIEAIEKCHLELMREVRLGRRLLTSIRDRYAYAPTETESPEEQTKKAAKLAPGNSKCQSGSRK